MTEQTEKSVFNVKEVQECEIYGYLGGVITYTPKTFTLEETAEEKRFSVDIEPMSDADVVALNTLETQEIQKYSLWLTNAPAKIQKSNDKYMESLTDEKIKLTKADFENISEMTDKRKSLRNNALKLNIARKYISNLSEPHPQAQAGTITELAWERMPLKYKVDIYREIKSISVLTDVDAVNL